MQRKLAKGATILTVGMGAAVTGGAAGQEIHAGVHQTPAVILQVIKRFDNPEGAIVSADGQQVFISSAAEIGDRAEEFAWTEGEGYISKLEVLPSGRLEMVEERLVTDLTAPLGMGVLPVGTEKFPEGTIFVATGSAPLRDSAGEVIKDPKRLRTKLVAFNDQGDVLGEIDTGTGSIFEEVNGSPVVLLNALGFDPEGNLYFADTAFGAEQFEPPIEGKGGIWMIPVSALDALAEAQRPDDMPKFIPVPGNPDGVEVSPADGKIYVNTVGPVGGAPDPADGGIYALTKDDFTGAATEGKLPPPVDAGLGALDGLDFTAGGAMLNTQIKPDVPAQIYVNCPGKAATTLELQPGGLAAELSGPADIGVRRTADGPQLVVVPELMARDPSAGNDEVTVLALPADFDEACGGS